MMKYLKDRKYYEDLYDRGTIAIGWREGGALRDAREEFYAKVTNPNRPDVLEFWWERIYWWLVELPFLLPRWEGRESGINALMADDRLLDERLENARPHIEPTCTSCSGRGLRLILKELLHRDGSDRKVLFMFDCGLCKVRSAYWEDGSEWVSPTVPCPKCSSPLHMTVKTTSKFMTTTTTCEKCGHKEVERVDITKPRSEGTDSDFERDKAIFCLTDERAKIMQEYRVKWEDVVRLLDEEMERDADKDLYDMVAKIERLKIPQLMERMRTEIEKAGYIELTFDRPELGGYVTIGFSCMDSNSSREDSKSRKVLKKAVNTALANSNWRLMSEGISYRLGYLSSRVRAYESEEELAGLLRNVG